MTHEDSQLSCEEVLDAFAMEPSLGSDILERYLQDYPEFTAELIELSYELSSELCEDEIPLSEEDQALIDKAWQRHVEAAPTVVVDPLAYLSIQEKRQIAQQLDVPQQVITAFREHRIEPTSVPLFFLERLATLLDSTIEILMSALKLPPVPDPARSYKSDSRPETPTQVTFEQILIDAGVSPENRTQLMKGKD
jgi:hypothetical protein